MADLADIITNAVADATPDNTPSPEGNDPVDTDPVDESANEGDPTGDPDPVNPDPADTSDDPDPAREAAKTPEIDPTTGKPKVEEKPVEKDELTKELEALGLKEPKEGERENRLPFKRVKKITENYGKKVAARYEAELAPLKTEVSTLRQTAETVKNVDRLIATDPDRYLTMLAGIHPKLYGKYLQGGTVAAPAGDKPAPKAESKLGPRPAADHKFEDGSMGYTPEQHEKLLDWVAAKAKEDALVEARAELDQRFKPLDDERKGREEFHKQVDDVKAETARIREAYGPEVLAKYENQIVEHMKKNPTMSASKAAREIIMPALQADRNKMRTEILVETKERPKAAKTAPVDTSKSTEEDNPTTIEGVIAKSIAGLKGR